MTQHTLQPHALPRQARARALPQLPRVTTTRRLGVIGRRAARVALVIAMALMSVAVWLVSPVVWMWIASQASDPAHPGLGPYALLFAGILITTVVLTRLLGASERAYARLGQVRDQRVHRAWLRASGQQKRERAHGGPLPIVMTASVIAAIGALVTFAVVSGHPFEPVPFFGLG